uniref:Uncharacterized protein n=1 Tax=Trichobilharzia regenti TaxID=157069 RepID=A0AA85JWJ0_TRIRE|nr:unnamed protein product [Trichobilharzia regenti]
MNMTAREPECLRGWQNTATNVLGDKRNSMCKNILHQRSILGRCNTFCLNTPPLSFTYGMKNLKTTGVADALHWSDDTNIHGKSNDHMYLTRDFIALNCESVRQGVTTSKEMTHFRALNDRLRQKQAKHKSRGDSPKAYLNITHGVANKASTPIEEIISHKYQRDWIDAQMKKAESRRKKSNETKIMSKNIYQSNTEAALRRNCMKKEKEESFWKLKEFERKAVGKLDTFRSEDCRKQSLEMHKSSRISRAGLFGHGIQRTGECA